MITQKKLEKLYWDLHLLEFESTNLKEFGWSSDDIKRLNLTKHKVGYLLLERYGKSPQDVIKSKIEKYMENKK